MAEKQPAKLSVAFAGAWVYVWYCYCFCQLRSLVFLAIRCLISLALLDDDFFLVENTTQVDARHSELGDLLSRCRVVITTYAKEASIIRTHSVQLCKWMRAKRQLEGMTQFLNLRSVSSFAYMYRRLLHYILCTHFTYTHVSCHPSMHAKRVRNVASGGVRLFFSCSPQIAQKSHTKRNLHICTRALCINYRNARA